MLEEIRKSLHCIATVVPAHNEELVLGHTLEALKKILLPKHIYVADDGSSDRTLEIARSHIENVLTLSPKRGKIKAIEALIKHFSLFDTYDLILFVDADSEVDPYFLCHALAAWQENTACIIGQVVNRKENVINVNATRVTSEGELRIAVNKTKNIIDAFRTFEYFISHDIYKRAQTDWKTIMVAPGCASLYRTDVLRQLNFDSDTVTEDMDLTLQIQRRRQRLGEVRYVPQAKVTTQDPGSIEDFCRQINRWYSGFWQNLRKHRIPFGFQRLDLEVGSLAFQGIIGGAELFFTPSLIYFLGWKFVLILYLITFVFNSFLALIAALRKKRWDVAKYFPIFIVLSTLSSVVFFATFVRNLLVPKTLQKSRLAWSTVKRY